MPFPLQAIFVLVILGFVFYLFQKNVPIASPFKEVIYFLTVVALVLWLLEGFGVLHTHYFPRWR